MITAVLSLDATVGAADSGGIRHRGAAGCPAEAARVRLHLLSNTASVLLPVSNLTNLPAFAASGLSFTRFAGLTALPWLVAITAEYAVFRRLFAADLDAGAQAPAAEPRELPVFVLTTVAVTLAGFVLTVPPRYLFLPSCWRWESWSARSSTTGSPSP